jgi:hypothetical protein
LLPFLEISGEQKRGVKDFGLSFFTFESVGRLAIEDLPFDFFSFSFVGCSPKG